MQLSAGSRVNLLAVESASFSQDFGLEEFIAWHNSERLKQADQDDQQRLAIHSLDACIASTMLHIPSLNVSVF